MLGNRWCLALRRFRALLRSASRQAPPQPSLSYNRQLTIQPKGESDEQNRSHISRRAIGSRDRSGELGEFLGNIIAGIYEGIRNGVLDSESHFDALN